MKKIVHCLLVVQLVLLMAGCCCPCSKKAAEKAPEQTQPQPEQPKTE